MDNLINIAGEQTINFADLQKIYHKAVAIRKAKVYTDSIVFNKMGQFLILKRAMGDSFAPDMWCLPGGKMESTDRSEIEAAKRELMEETNIVPDGDNTNVPNYTCQYKNSDDSTSHYFTFGASEIDIVLDVKEQAYYQWIFPEEIHSFKFLFDLGDRLGQIFSKMVLPKPMYSEAEEQLLKINGAILREFTQFPVDVMSHITQSEELLPTTKPVPHNILVNVQSLETEHTPILHVPFMNLKKSLDLGAIDDDDYLDSIFAIKSEWKADLQKAFDIGDIDEDEYLNELEKGETREVGAEFDGSDGRRYITTQEHKRKYVGKGIGAKAQMHIQNGKDYHELGGKEKEAKEIAEKAQAIIEHRTTVGKQADKIRQANPNSRKKFQIGERSIHPDKSHPKYDPKNAHLTGRPHILTHTDRWEFIGNGNGKKAKAHIALAEKHKAMVDAGQGHLVPTYVQQKREALEAGEKARAEKQQRKTEGTDVEWNNPSTGEQHTENIKEGDNKPSTSSAPNKPNEEEKPATKPTESVEQAPKSEQEAKSAAKDEKSSSHDEEIAHHEGEMKKHKTTMMNDDATAEQSHEAVDKFHHHKGEIARVQTEKAQAQQKAQVEAEARAKAEAAKPKEPSHDEQIAHHEGEIAKHKAVMLDDDSSPEDAKSAVDKLHQHKGEIAKLHQAKADAAKPKQLSDDEQIAYHEGEMTKHRDFGMKEGTSPEDVRGAVDKFIHHRAEAAKIKQTKAQAESSNTPESNNAPTKRDPTFQAVVKKDAYKEYAKAKQNNLRESGRAASTSASKQSAPTNESAKSSDNSTSKQQEDTNEGSRVHVLTPSGFKSTNTKEGKEAEIKHETLAKDRKSSDNSTSKQQEPEAKSETTASSTHSSKSSPQNKQITHHEVKKQEAIERQNKATSEEDKASIAPVIDYHHKQVEKLKKEKAIADSVKSQSKSKSESESKVEPKVEQEPKVETTPKPKEESKVDINSLSHDEQITHHEKEREKADKAFAGATTEEQKDYLASKYDHHDSHIDRLKAEKETASKTESKEQPRKDVSSLSHDEQIAHHEKGVNESRQKFIEASTPKEVGEAQSLRAHHDSHIDRLKAEKEAAGKVESKKPSFDEQMDASKKRVEAARSHALSATNPEIVKDAYDRQASRLIERENKDKPHDEQIAHHKVEKQKALDKFNTASDDQVKTNAMLDSGHHDTRIKALQAEKQAVGKLESNKASEKEQLNAQPKDKVKVERDDSYDEQINSHEKEKLKHFEALRNENLSPEEYEKIHNDFLHHHSEEQKLSNARRDSNEQRKAHNKAIDEDDLKKKDEQPKLEAASEAPKGDSKTNSKQDIENDKTKSSAHQEELAHHEKEREKAESDRDNASNSKEEEKAQKKIDHHEGHISRLKSEKQLSAAEKYAQARKNSFDEVDAHDDEQNKKRIEPTEDGSSQGKYKGNYEPKRKGKNSPVDDETSTYGRAFSAGNSKEMVDAFNEGKGKDNPSEKLSAQEHLQKLIDQKEALDKLNEARTDAGLDKKNAPKSRIKRGFNQIATSQVLNHLKGQISEHKAVLNDSEATDAQKKEASSKHEVASKKYEDLKEQLEFGGNGPLFQNNEKKQSSEAAPKKTLEPKLDPKSEEPKSQEVQNPITPNVKDESKKPKEKKISSKIDPQQRMIHLNGEMNKHQHTLQHKKGTASEAEMKEAQTKYDKAYKQHQELKNKLKAAGISVDDKNGKSQISEGQKQQEPKTEEVKPLSRNEQIDHHRGEMAKHKAIMNDRSAPEEKAREAVDKFNHHQGIFEKLHDERNKQEIPKAVEKPVEIPKPVETSKKEEDKLKQPEPKAQESKATEAKPTTNTQNIRSYSEAEVQSIIKNKAVDPNAFQQMQADKFKAKQQEFRAAKANKDSPQPKESKETEKPEVKERESLDSIRNRQKEYAEAREKAENDTMSSHKEKWDHIKLSDVDKLSPEDKKAYKQSRDKYIEVRDLRRQREKNEQSTNSTSNASRPKAPNKPLSDTEKKIAEIAHLTNRYRK